jgi:Gas vesicle synthesis protein GvpL/GvpF
VSDELRYVYAVCRPFRKPLPDGLRGVAGSRPHLLRGDGLVAVQSIVPSADFAEEPLRARLEDLDWLAGTARAHQAVVDALIRLTTAVPLRLATVYRDDDGVRRALERERERFMRTLDGLDGTEEWGVKVYVDPTAAPSEADSAPPSAAASGRDYLRRRQRQVTARESAEGEAAEVARVLHAALARHAVRARLRRTQDGRLAQAAGRNLMNAAYLVPREHAEDFLQQVERLVRPDPNIRVEVTGPWAPYSFAGMEEEQPA